MKKHSLGVIGIILQIIGIAFMLYGFSNNKQLLWAGLAIVFVGLALILVGLFKNSAKGE